MYKYIISNNRILQEFIILSFELRFLFLKNVFEITILEKNESFEII